MKRFILDPPEGFVGLDRNRDVAKYHRNLPHWRQVGATYFVTFRMKDSLPKQALKKLREVRADWIRQNGGEPESDEEWQQFGKVVSTEEERWLDQGCGECLLRKAEVASIVEAKLRKFYGLRYELGAFVVMPNHVHALVRPLEGYELSEITKGWKGVSSREIGRLLQRATQPLWQDESFDSIVRDAEHLYRIVQYIGRNPAKAKLTTGFRRWVCDDWISAGYGFQDES